jgi:hypothetical protein
MPPGETRTTEPPQHRTPRPTIPNSEHGPRVHAHHRVGSQHGIIPRCIETYRAAIGGNRTMRDAPSSYLTDALITTQVAGPSALLAPGVRRERFRPLAWLRGRLFRPHGSDGTTLVPASSSIPPIVESRGQALRAAHRTLHGLMKERPALRRLMPHLAHIERSLRKLGSRALLRLSANVLQRGLEQLETLQADEPRDALRAMRTRLVEAIALRNVARSVTSPAALEVGGGTEAALEVMEASQSEFDEVERSWTGSMPLDSPRWDDSRH